MKDIDVKTGGFPIKVMPLKQTTLLSPNAVLDIRDKYKKKMYSGILFVRDA